MPLSELPEKERYPVAVYDGRLNMAKSLDHAIRAFRITKKRVPNAELWIIGNGYFKRNLEKMATKVQSCLATYPMDKGEN